MSTLLRRTSVAVGLLAALAACESGTDVEGSGGPAAADAERGAELFAANCAVCHGPEAQGTETGPPLVHEVYEPSHHGDEAFQLAVAQGASPHHWDFGPMPPVEGLDREDVADITAWVRERQREAGID